MEKYKTPLFPAPYWVGGYAGLQMISVIYEMMVVNESKRTAILHSWAVIFSAPELQILNAISIWHQRICAAAH